MKVIYDDSLKHWRDCLEGEDGIYLDGLLKTKLDNIKKIVKKNFDATIIIVGAEGSGKSTLGFVISQYLINNKLTINNVAEGSADALDKLEQMPDGSLIIVDEAELLFSSRETMSKEQRQLTQVMKVIRQKNMILVLITPVFFDLASYIAVSRSLFLIRTYTDKEFNRGKFCYWGKKKKLRLYHEGKKRFGSYSKPKADFFGKFTNYIPPFNDEYLALKRRSLQEAFDGKDNAMEKLKEKLKETVRDEIVMEYLKENQKTPLKEVMKTFKIDKNRLTYLKYTKMGIIPKENEEIVV
jgi:hypothetical protein